MAVQLHDHPLQNSILEQFPSAYRCGHSKKTALVRVQNDILNAMDKQHYQWHLIPSISGDALKWFKSYPSERHQTVYIVNEKSKPQKLIFGIPQGSALDPILFSLTLRVFIHYNTRRVRSL